jgi:uncharacterized protein
VSREEADALLAAWDEERAIDHHCHPLRRWPFQLTDVELRAAFTEAIDPRVAAEHMVNAVAYQDALRRIATELGCQPDEAAILTRRNGADPGEYARRLLTRTATDLMLVDQGFATSDAFTLQEQGQATGIRQLEIVRLEKLAEGLVGSSADPREWFQHVRTKLRDAVAGGAVGIKTICAYRASLTLQPVDTDALGVAFTSLRHRAERGESLRLSGNALCHALLFEAAQECAQLEVPLQVHCGFGDPDEDLAETSPLGLRRLFIDPAYRGLRVALLHCYPYHREAAYLCSVFPDVYMDLSLAIPMAGLDGRRALGEALGLCPITKLLYATDATRYPEVYLVAAAAYREALADALGDLVHARMLTTDRAMLAGSDVLSGNARRLYRLTS